MPSMLSTKPVRPQLVALMFFLVNHKMPSYPVAFALSIDTLKITRTFDAEDLISKYNTIYTHISIAIDIDKNTCIYRSAYSIDIYID